MKKLLFLFLLLFVVSVAAEEVKQPASPDNEVVISKELKIVAKNEHEENAEQHFVIEVQYPQITGTDLSAQAQKFNQLVSEEVKNEVTQFKKYVLADMPHMNTLPEEERKNTFNMNYDVQVVKPGKNELISVRLAIEGFQAGRAHPYHNHRVINFDLTDGKLLTLSDLFKPKSNYLKVIANYANIKLNETLEDKLMIAEGTKPIAKNFRNWNLESDGFLFTFDEYQVAAYVYGAQEVRVPYEVLKKVIAPSAIIYPCVVKPSSCVA